MARIDFKKANEKVTTLKEMDGLLIHIFADKENQEEAIRRALGALRDRHAAEKLREVSVEELRKSKAGIRVAALQEAGYHDLRALALAKDWELRTVDGIGEGQVAAIRGILKEFLARLTEHQTVRLFAEEGDAGLAQEENDALLRAIAAYRMGETVRADGAALREGFHGFVMDVTERAVALRPARWFFSLPRTKEATVQALSEIDDFFRDPVCDRVQHLIDRYDAAMRVDAAAAREDFRRSGADYYALIETLDGTREERPLVYDSIPQELATAVDALPLDLSLFRGNLRAYQAFGAKYILHQGRALLGDEMGLGKTVQAIAAMAAVAAASPGAHFLVVCPASVLVNWCREIRKFSGLTDHLLHGSGMFDALARWQAEGGVAVTNYESMGKIAGSINDRMRLAMLVIDEAHYIKNPDAKRTKYIHLLEDESDRILLMTGTPLENRVEEMCALIDFLRPELAQKARELAYMSRVPEFREMLAPVYLRRLREQVLEELPPIEEIREWCAMTTADREAYGAEVRARNFTAVRRVSFLQKTLTASSKGLRLLELVENAAEENRKVVVYSFFLETVGKVATLLGERCAGVITGSTEPALRQREIDRFTDAPGGSVLVCQIQAGGTGLNIQTASIVIFCEPQVKPSLTNQAISRVYRMGQVRNVLVFHLLCEGTVDEAMVRRLADKQAEFDLYADESAMAAARAELIDRDWVRDFLEEENKKYLPMVVEQNT